MCDLTSNFFGNGPRGFPSRGSVHYGLRQPLGDAVEHQPDPAGGVQIPVRGEPDGEAHERRRLGLRADEHGSGSPHQKGRATTPRPARAMARWAWLSSAMATTFSGGTLMPIWWSIADIGIGEVVADEGQRLERTLREKLGRRIERGVVLDDEFRGQVGLIGPCMADGDIGLPPHEVGHGERHDHLDAQRGGFLADLREDRGQKLCRVEMGGGDRDNARDLLALAAGGERGGMGGLGHGAEMLDQRRPASVSSMRLPARVKRLTPSSSSSAVTCRPSVGWVRPSARGGGGEGAGLGRHHGGAGAVPVEGGVFQSMRKRMVILPISAIHSRLIRMGIPHQRKRNRWSER
jgi:hypothetical protein